MDSEGNIYVSNELVHHIQKFDGSGKFLFKWGSEGSTLYLLADVTNIVSPRYTHVYYWPTTQEYKADWDRLNETLNGTLEIAQNGRLVYTLRQTQYVIQEPPPPPEAPAPFRFLSPGIHDGFPVNLTAGTYVMRLRGEDGQIVPLSEKRLIVFSPRREGIGYTIVPQDKWTTPEQAHEPGQIIYARNDSVIYLQPFAEKEYNELFYARLEAPQSPTGSPERWTWRSLQPTRRPRRAAPRAQPQFG